MAVTQAKSHSAHDPDADPASWGTLAGPDPHAGYRAAQDLAASLGHTIDLSYGLVEAGRSLDLAGLENRVGRLTAAVLDLDTPFGRQMRPALAGLRDRLDRLYRAMAARAPP